MTFMQNFEKWSLYFAFVILSKNVLQVCVIELDILL